MEPMLAPYLWTALFALPCALVALWCAGACASKLAKKRPRMPLLLQIAIFVGVGAVAFVGFLVGSVTLAMWLGL